MNSRLISEAELLVDIEYGQLYIYGSNPWAVAPESPEDARLRCEVGRILAAIRAGTDQPAPGNNGTVITSLFPASPAWTQEHVDYLERDSQRTAEVDPVRALDNAYELKIGIGVAGGVIDLLAGTRAIDDASLTIQLWSEPPASEYPDWEHVVEADLDITDGKVCFEAPTCEVLKHPLPNNRYRVRIARNEHPQDVGDPRESYQLQFWPRTQDSGPTVVKQSSRITERF
jgi:hypothetical protein